MLAARDNVCLRLRSAAGRRKTRLKPLLLRFATHFSHQIKGAVANLYIRMFDIREKDTLRQGFGMGRGVREDTPTPRREQRQKRGCCKDCSWCCSGGGVVEV